MTTLTHALTGILALALLAAPSSQVLAADERVVTDDGREVLLRQDGSWEFLSDDRFATTADGRRVRLRGDGSWYYTGDVPPLSDQEVRTRDLVITLQQAVIQTREVKAQKNKRISSQTIFHVQLELSPHANSGITISESDMSLIEVKDNRGRNYPVLSMHTSKAELAPGATEALEIRVDGSPQWWKSVKSMDLVFNPGIFGIQEPVRINRPVDDIVKNKVDSLDR